MKKCMMLMVGVVCFNLCGCTMMGGRWTHIYDDVSQRLCFQVNRAEGFEPMDKRSINSQQGVKVYAAKTNRE